MGSNVFLRLLFVLLQSSCEIASKFVWKRWMQGELGPWDNRSVVCGEGETPIHGYVAET